MMLEKVTGAECPRCGCEDSRVIRTRNGWGGSFESRSCNACGKLFTVNAKAEEAEADEPVAVPYVRVACRCPKCGNENPKVTSSRGEIRFHRCGRCDHRFKSYENND